MGEPTPRNEPHAPKKGDGLIVLYDVVVRDEEGETILYAAGIHGASAAHNLVATFFGRRREPGRTPGHTCTVTSKRVSWQTLYPPDPRRGKDIETAEGEA